MAQQNPSTQFAQGEGVADVRACPELHDEGGLIICGGAAQGLGGVGSFTKQNGQIQLRLKTLTGTAAEIKTFMTKLTQFLSEVPSQK
jgi:hypothetical protein